MAEPRLLAEHVAALAAQRDVAAAFTLQVADCSIRVRTDSLPLADELRDYYRDFIVDPVEPHIDVLLLDGPVAALPVTFRAYPPSPGKTRVKDEYADLPDGRILRKRLTGMVFFFGGAHNVAVGPCRANSNQVVNFINNRFMQFEVERGYLLCHSAGVALNGRGLLLAGMAGRGKSTLALHVLEHGVDYISNDRLLVRRRDTLEMLGLPKLPRVNPGTILHHPRLTPLLPNELRERVEQLSAEELWELEHKYDVDVNRLFGDGRTKLTAQMVGAVVLTWTRDGGPPRFERVSLTERRDLLQAIIKPLGAQVHFPPNAGPAEPSEESYLREFGDCPVYELTGGVDFEVAARHCLNVMKGTS